jgi:hypothetical protein
VEAGWGTFWSALATTDWTVTIRHWQNWRQGGGFPQLPYTQPGSPGDRLANWLAQLRAWRKAILIPTAGHALGAIAAGLGLSLLLSAVLGPKVLLLTIAALALMQIAVTLDRGRGKAGAGWDGVLRLGLPWLVGHIIFAPHTLPSLALAAGFSIAAAGVGSEHRSLERTLWILGQLAVTTLFLPLHSHLTVTFLFLLLIPQILISSPANGQQGWTHRAWPWMAAGMFLAAWTL